MSATHLTRIYKIRCVHQHRNPDLSNEENERLYFKCHRPHGHEYQIEVTCRGDIDPQTGLALQRHFMDQVVQKNIVEPFDGSFLNEHIGNTSGEIIVEQFDQILRRAFGEKAYVGVKLKETRKNSFSTFEGA